MLSIGLAGLMVLTGLHMRQTPASDIPLREVWKISGYLTDGNLKHRG